MWPWTRRQEAPYGLLDNRDGVRDSLDSQKVVKSFTVVFTVNLAILLIFTFASLSAVLGRTPSRSSCAQPAVRQEWRSLTDHEKRHFISAFNCLASRPSGVINGSLYDEFTWLHKDIGKLCGCFPVLASKPCTKACTSSQFLVFPSVASLLLTAI